jgi:hypothetical protein
VIALALPQYCRLCPHVVTSLCPILDKRTLLMNFPFAMPHTARYGAPAATGALRKVY